MRKESSTSNFQVHLIIESTKNSLKVETNSSFLMESPKVTTSNTHVSSLETKIGEGFCFAIFQGKTFLRKC